MVENPLANAGESRDIKVPSLCWDDLLEEQMATHSSILAWETSWTEEPGGPGGPSGHKEAHMCAKLLQSFLILCQPVDSSPPGSSVHGILQARIVKWVAMPSSKGSFRPRD